MKQALSFSKSHPLLLCLGLLLGLYLIYNLSLSLSPLSSLESLQLTHAVLACLILFRVRNHPQPGKAPLARHFGLTWETLAYIPGLLVGVTIVVLLLWRGIPNDISATLATKTFFFAALIVPMVEEVVFRLGVFRLLPAHLSPLAKVTYSALVFACAHGRYGEQWFIPPAGLPIGPLLLGLSCGAVFALSGRLMPAILLHAVCNATGFVYPLVLDDEQFSWLRWLYG